MKDNYLAQAWLVLVMALSFGAALAAVHLSLGERIEANKLQETLSQIPLLVPGAQAGTAEILAGRTVYRAMDGDQQVGWVIQASGQGFADRIEVLVGLDASARTLTGLYVLEQKETPGLGNKITDADWRTQFTGKTAAEPVTATKGNPAAQSQISAITGATISSESVCDIVNEAVSEVREALQRQGGGT